MRRHIIFGGFFFFFSCKGIVEGILGYPGKKEPLLIRASLYYKSYLIFIRNANSMLNKRVYINEER